MDRAPSTIARELKRSSGTQFGYQPAYAEQQAKSRRWRGSRLLRKPDLQEEVLKGLEQGWSPAQVAGRLKKEQRRTVISHETIYRFIDSQIRRTKDYSWRHYLPRGKSKRGWRGHKGGSPVDHIQYRVAIYRRTGDMGGMKGMMKMMEQCNDMMKSVQHEAEKAKEPQKK